MKNILRSLLGGLAAALLAVVAQAADLAPGVFSAGTVKGDVTYKLPGTTQYLALTAGTALPKGSTVKTGAGSLATIVFSNGSTATLRPETEVEVIKFDQEAFTGPLPTNSEPSVSDTELKIVNGEVVSKVSKLKKGSKFTVNSPVGAAGVRGTTFSVTYNAKTGAYTVSTLDGEVVFKKNAAGKEIPVRANESYDGTAVTPLTAAQVAAIETAIKNQPAPAQGSPIQTIEVTVPDVDTSVSPN